MSENEEDEARATGRYADILTGETVGYLYTWEDGERQPLWLGGARSNAALIPLEIPAGFDEPGEPSKA